MTVIAMSRREIARVQVLRDLELRRFTVVEAAQLMGLTLRQVFRLAKHYRTNGPDALASKRRRKPSNRSHPAIVRTEVLALIKARHPPGMGGLCGTRPLPAVPEGTAGALGQPMTSASIAR